MSNEPSILEQPFVLKADDRDVFDRMAGLITAFATVHRGDEITVMTGIAFDHEHGPRQAAIVVGVADDNFCFTCDAARMVIHVLIKMISEHVCGGGECVFALLPTMIDLIGQGITQAETDFHKSRLQ